MNRYRHWRIRRRYRKIREVLAWEWHWTYCVTHEEKAHIRKLEEELNRALMSGDPSPDEKLSGLVARREG